MYGVGWRGRGPEALAGAGGIGVEYCKAAVHSRLLVAFVKRLEAYEQAVELMRRSFMCAPTLQVATCTARCS